MIICYFPLISFKRKPNRYCTHFSKQATRFQNLSIEHQNCENCVRNCRTVKARRKLFFFHKRCPPRGSPSCPSYEVAIFCACSSCEFFATLLTPRHEFFFSRAIHVVNKPRKQAPSRAPIRNNEWTKGRNPDFDPLC